MKKTLIMMTMATLALGGCRDKGTGAGETAGETAGTETAAQAEMWNGFTKISPQDIDRNVFELIGEDWMVVTAGTPEKFNTMTASWGGMGVVWQRPVTWITIRNTRYTYEFLTGADTYTLTFFGGGHKEAMAHLGRVSGRDGDKIAQTDLTAMETPTGSMSFEQATMIIECRKIYQGRLEPTSMFVDEIARDYLGSDNRHVLFFGEIVNVWKK